MQSRDWGLGDTVEVRPQYRNGNTTGKWRVKKFMRVNVEVENVLTGAILRGRPDVFQKVESSDALQPSSPYADLLKEIEDARRFTLGTVVTAPNGANSSKWRYPAGTKFVVIKTSGDRINIAKMGGDGGQYWRMSPRSLEVCTDF